MPKPSERIKELVELLQKIMPNKDETAMLFGAIMRYLDEQYEKEQSQQEVKG